MSDIMLIGVLRMPINEESDPMTIRQFIDRGRQAADKIEELEKIIQQKEDKIQELQGIKPEPPPYPPHSHNYTELPRYGIRWNGENLPISTPMEDGYWTPYFLAQEFLHILSVENQQLKQKINNQHLKSFKNKR